MEKTAITPEQREEMLALLQSELDRRALEAKENRTVYQQVCNGLKDELTAFNYTRTRSYTTVDGTSGSWQYEENMAYKIQTAIGTLLRAVYQVDYVRELSAANRQEIKKFVSDVLGLMKRQTGACTK